VRPRRLTPITTDPFTQPAVAIPWPATPEGPLRDVSTRGTRRVLVGGVGYRNLRDMSAGPELIERLRKLEWPVSVEVEDLSFGAVHVLHWLQERPPFDALVLVAAVARGREPGSVTCGTWRAPPTTGEAVQGAIAEAVTGVISLDTLLTVLGYFAALPARVTVIEVEPRDDDWGPEFSPLVQVALEEAVRMVETEVRALVR
jgi:hydrogenase maturation protease